MRAGLLRKQLMTLAKENKELSLFAAIEEIYRRNRFNILLHALMGPQPQYSDMYPSEKAVIMRIGALIKAFMQRPEGVPSLEEIKIFGKDNFDRAIQVRDGLELLEDSLAKPTNTSRALGHVLLALKTGNLRVNGQLPDEDYPLGEYLLHGGRVKFDISALPTNSQREFFDFITKGRAQPRVFATHGVRGKDASGSPAEIRSGFFYNIYNGIRYIFGASKHFGIHLAIGGDVINPKEDLNTTPDESGQWGHMYVYSDTDLLMVGIEASAPGKRNLRTGVAHSLVGTPGDLSAFLEPKINSSQLRDKQIAAGKAALSTSEKNNWATVKISPEQWQILINDDEEVANYVKLARMVHPDAQTASENREAKMQAWAQATKEANKNSYANLVGGCFIILGIALAFVPIPFVTQLAGAWLTSIGISMVFFGTCTIILQKDPVTASTLYQKNLGKLPIESQDDETEAFNTSLANLAVLGGPQTRPKSASSSSAPAAPTVTTPIVGEPERDPTRGLCPTN